MGFSTFPAASAASKTRFQTTLTSGTSYTVPAGVTYLNVTLYGGGGGGGSGSKENSVTIMGTPGTGGQVVSSTLSVTAGASITYAIGAGGASLASGGTTTFTGATSAAGGNPGNQAGALANVGPAGSAYHGAANGGGGGGYYALGSGGAGGAGGSGSILVEYWV